MLQKLASWFSPFSRMNPDREKRNRHALVGNPDVWKMKRNFQINFLKANGLQPYHKLFDLGCGTLRGGIPIIQYLDKGGYTGFDIREIVIAEAKKELASEHLVHKTPELLYGNSVLEVSTDSRYDFIWAFSVLIHLSEDKLREVMTFAAKQLKPDGAFFANVNIGEREMSKWLNYPLIWRSAAFWQEIALQYGLRAEFMGTIRDLGHESGNEDQDQQVMLRFRLIETPGTYR